VHWRWAGLCGGDREDVKVKSEIQKVKNIYYFCTKSKLETNQKRPLIDSRSVTSMPHFLVQYRQ
jgi:hypothetical protein